MFYVSSFIGYVIKKRKKTKTNAIYRSAQENQKIFPAKLPIDREQIRTKVNYQLFFGLLISSSFDFLKMIKLSSFQLSVKRVA